MKTTSRKRLLISSVAMLLVAMLALGTATFAWFSTSTTAKANNLKVQTIQSSNLLIRKNFGGTQTGQHRLAIAMKTRQHLSLYHQQI